MDLCAPKPPRALERKGTWNRATTVPQQVTVLAHTATSLRAFACPRSEQQSFTKRILLWILCPGRALEAVDRRDTHPRHHNFLLIQRAIQLRKIIVKKSNTRAKIFFLSSVGKISFFIVFRKHAYPSVVSGNQYLFSYYLPRMVLKRVSLLKICYHPFPN